MYIISQVLVCISDLFYIISMFNKNKKGLVFYLIISTFLFASHYLFLGGLSGAVLGYVELVFLIVLYILEKKGKTKYNKYISILTIILTLILSIITWGGWISLLPMFAMIVYLSTMMCKNLIIVKSGNFIRLILNGIYMLILKSYFGAVLTIVILVCTIVGILIDEKNKKLNLQQINKEN
ncbi:MAG: YgjV family protein [Candidatus Onthoplasma sp.]